MYWIHCNDLKKKRKEASARQINRRISVIRFSQHKMKDKEERRVKVQNTSSHTILYHIEERS